MTVISIPLPIRSSIYTQKNCIISITIEIIKVTMKGPMKERMLNKYSFFKEKLQKQN
jgi:hypothetical protein